MDSRFEHLLSFLKEIDKYKFVERKICLKNRSSRENDAEHTWHMAMFLMLFEKDLPKNLDFLKVLKMALIHDLPEIYAGDTFAFDYEGRKTKKERENKAANKLFSQLPADLKLEFQSLYDELEAGSTSESKIVKAFDHMHALFQNTLADGKDLKENNISFKEVQGYRDRDTKDNAAINKIYDILLSRIKDILK